MEIEEIST